MFESQRMAFFTEISVSKKIKLVYRILADTQKKYMNPIELSKLEKKISFNNFH